MVCLPARVDARDREHVVAHPEAHLPFGEVHLVDALAVRVIRRARVAGKHLNQGCRIITHKLEQLGGAFDCQDAPLWCDGKPARRIWVRICVRQVRLDIVDGGAVHKVRPAHVKHETVPAWVFFQAREFHA